MSENKFHPFWLHYSSDPLHTIKEEWRDIVHDVLDFKAHDYFWKLPAVQKEKVSEDLTKKALESVIQANEETKEKLQGKFGKGYLGTVRSKAYCKQLLCIVQDPISMIIPGGLPEYGVMSAMNSFWGDNWELKFRAIKRDCWSPSPNPGQRHGVDCVRHRIHRMQKDLLKDLDSLEDEEEELWEATKKVSANRKSFAFWFKDVEAKHRRGEFTISDADELFKSQWKVYEVVSPDAYEEYQNAWNEYKEGLKNSRKLFTGKRKKPFFEWNQWFATAGKIERMENFLEFYSQDDTKEKINNIALALRNVQDKTGLFYRRATLIYDPLMQKESGFGLN